MFALWTWTKGGYLRLVEPVADERHRPAERGELDSAAGVERQVERMLDSPRLESGVRAMFTDLWALDDFVTLEKDPTLFPAFRFGL